jgi:hypothetical protein
MNTDPNQSDDDIRTTCEIEIVLMLKIGCWKHPPILLAFIAKLFEQAPTRFVRVRGDGLILMKHSYGRWASLDSFNVMARQFRDIAATCRLDGDEYGVLMGRLASLKWRSSR